MSDSLTTFRAWAPDDALWTAWAKPVLFSREPAARSDGLDCPDVPWMDAPDTHTALVVDLPGDGGVLEGLGLAAMGYRPVPLYNGVYGPNTGSMLVKVRDIVVALYRGAYTLAGTATTPGLDIPPDAPPAFLLDANRMQGFGNLPGTFDNRWCVFPQDMPSASFFLRHGIHRVVVRSDEIRNDLAHILRRYQEQGMLIALHDGNHLREIQVARPSRFRGFLYRVQTIAGLRRNAAGGFGGFVPEPTQSSGGRSYGIG